jgi:hypothetical protein
MKGFVANVLALCALTVAISAQPLAAAEFSMSTRGGKGFTLETAGDQVTQKTTDFVICGETVETIAKVKLWMPEHGHGSSAVQLGATSEGCRVVTKVNFTMRGLWEVRLELTDGDTGAFELDVE